MRSLSRSPHENVLHAKRMMASNRSVVNQRIYRRMRDLGFGYVDDAKLPTTRAAACAPWQVVRLACSQNSSM
jgi:hypothetical protein